MKSLAVVTSVSLLEEMWQRGVLFESLLAHFKNKLDAGAERDRLIDDWSIFMSRLRDELRNDGAVL